MFKNEKQTDSFFENETLQEKIGILQLEYKYIYYTCINKITIKIKRAENKKGCSKKDQAAYEVILEISGTVNAGIVLLN